jgi:hypothetical protein
VEPPREQFAADVQAAIERVHRAMPDDPGDAEGVVSIALDDIGEQHRV